MSERLLSLDQSSHVTGWSIFEDGKLEKHGKFKYDDMSAIVRIIKLRNAVNQLIEDETITKVALEEIQMQGNVNNVVTFKTLAFVMGVLLVLLEEKKIPYETISSSTWKSICGVKGKVRAEQKRDAQRFVLEEYETTAVQDIVDAICIGHAICKTSKKIEWKA